MADILHDLALRLSTLLPDTAELFECSMHENQYEEEDEEEEEDYDNKENVDGGLLQNDSNAWSVLPSTEDELAAPASPTPPEDDPLDSLFTAEESTLFEHFIREINAERLPDTATPPKRPPPIYRPRLIRLDTQTLAACSSPIPVGPLYATHNGAGAGVNEVEREDDPDFILTTPSYSPIQAYSRPPTPPRMPSRSAPLRTFGRMMRLPKTPRTPSALSPPPSPPTSTRTRRRVTFEPLRRSTRRRHTVIKPTNGVGFECAELPLRIKMCEIRSASFVDMSNETLILYLKGAGDTHDFEGYYLSDEFAVVCALPGNEYFADVLQQAQRAVSSTLARYFKHNPLSRCKLSPEKYVHLHCRKPDKRRRVVLYKPQDYRYAGCVLRFK